MPPARTPDHPVADQFTERWSSRSFLPDPLDDQTVLSVLEAARWSPSSSNNQPWRFAYALKPSDKFTAIHAALSPGNAHWAGNAPALLVFASTPTITVNGEQKPAKTHAFDAGAAWMSAALQAHAMGLSTHAMAGFNPDTLRANLQLPDDWALHAIVVLGHRAPPDHLPEDLRPRETQSPRRPLTESLV